MEESGVSSAGFSTTVQPAARPGAILRVPMPMGKFHCKHGEKNQTHT